MTTVNIFAKYNPTDENNFLKIRVELLKDPTKPEAFNLAIENLLSIRTVLRIIQRTGRLTELGGRVYYQQTLQWLQGSSPITNFISVPQIPNLDSIDENIANSFEQYVQNMHSNMRSEILFSNVELMHALLKSSNTQKVQEGIVEAAEELRDEFSKLSSEAIGAFNSSKDDAIGAIEKNKTDAITDLQTTRQTVVDEVNVQFSEATKRFQQAQALDKWGGVYDTLIEEIQERIRGKKYRKVR